MRTCFLLTIICLLTGCGKPQFENRAQFAELEPYAQEYVQKVLDAHFGTPTEMVVWDRLPLEPHDATGTVVSAADREVKLELTEPHQDILPGTELFWKVKGEEGEPATSQSVWIREWNEETHTAILEGNVTALPVENDQVILGPGAVLSRGRMLYAEHCQHCHGVSGDGAGPTSPYMNPKPRDYRLGLFKFTSTQGPFRAQRADLARVLELGIPGTYMPSFKLLTEREMNSLVEYVLWLSMRGETEYLMVKFLSDSYSTTAVKERVASGKEKKNDGAEEYETYSSIRQEFIDAVNDEDEIPAELQMFSELIASRWSDSQETSAVVTPSEVHKEYTEESIANGRKLYLSDALKCVSCHGEAGYGNGPQTWSITKDLDTGKDNPAPGLYDAWGNPLKPRNLHTGIFRGGRRPIDLYARLHAGIKGTPMPAFGGKLKDEELWDLVNYIYSVPFTEDVAGAGKVAEAQAAESSEVEPATSPEPATVPEKAAANVQAEESDTEVVVNN